MDQRVEEEVEEEAGTRGGGDGSRRADADMAAAAATATTTMDDAQLCITRASGSGIEVAPMTSDERDKDRTAPTSDCLLGMVKSQFSAFLSSTFLDGRY